MIYGGVKFDTSEYCFQEYVCEVLEVDCLESLTSKINYDVFDEYNDQDTYIHRKFYRAFEDNSVSNRFFADYRRLIKDELLPWFALESDEPMIYQARPSFRVHLDGNKAVGSFHRDADFGHSIHEVNIYMPLTKAFGHNTIWFENTIGEYEPIEADYGELVIWNGAITPHGNYLNDTGSTRVSFDFRLIRESRFVDEGNKTVTQGKSFSLGDYWTNAEMENSGA